MRRLFTLLIIFCFCQVDAQIIWNSGSYTFTKTVPFQQDCITSNVCLTRGPMSVIYNEVTENYLDGDGIQTWTPGGTTWAYGNIANWNTLTYQNLYTLNGANPPSMVNQPMVVHLTTNNIYLQLTFSYWGGAPQNGNYTYTRSVGPLGVDLIAFDAKNIGKETALNWATSGEKDNAGFYVQKSKDGENFENIAFVESKGSELGSQYSYGDKVDIEGLNYYRLKQMDYSGSYEFSRTARVNVRNEENVVYPNPARNYVIVSGPEFLQGTARLVNGMGMTMKENAVGNGIVDLSGLAPGMYYLIINNGSRTITERIIKQ